jgi:PBP1b-binding outer membrane lipoprotein LpoB
MKNLTVSFLLFLFIFLSSCTSTTAENTNTHIVITEQVSRSVEINNFSKIKERQVVSEPANDNSKNFETVIEVAIVILVTLLTNPH